MKQILNFMLLFLFGITYAQVGINTTAPHVSSMLDITSTTKGFLTPRMTFAQRNLIGTPGTGLLIYQTDSTPGFYYYNGTAWTTFGGSTGWGITGNTGTTPASNFLGTTDAQDLVIKTAGAEAIRVQSGGNVGIGTNAPSTKLHIQGIPPATSLSDGFEDNTVPPFATAGTGGNWTTTAVAGEFNSGTKGAKSGGGVDSGVSDLTYTTAALTYGGTVSFALKTSCESSDKLIFYINGVSQANWGGSTAWTTVSYTLPVGVSNLKWTYLKDSSVHTAPDRVYIDDVLVTVNGSGAMRIIDGYQAVGKVLTSDASGNASWQTAAPTYTFTNGLTNASSTIKLGGTLTEYTTIGATSYDLKVASSTIPNMLLVSSSSNVVKFGHDTIMYDNGSTYTVDGQSTTVKYVTSAQNGTTRGTTVGIGSVEYLTDIEDAIASSCTFLPMKAGSNLGSASSRWNTLYSTTVVNVSDANLKKNINPLNYGLKELMQLKPVSYNWKDNKIGKTIIPEKLQETRIGFLAQDLLKVIPEAVKTHDWKITEEKSGVYNYKENEVMGVMYNDIIPVIVKALQEQQLIIEKQQKEIDLLKKA